MTSQPIPLNDHHASKSDMQQFKRWQYEVGVLIAGLESRIRDLEQQREVMRTRYVSEPAGNALTLMARHPGLMLTATDWARNGGTFSDTVLRSLAGLGLVDRLDKHGVSDAGGHLYRINTTGLEWVSKREAAS